MKHRTTDAISYLEGYQKGRMSMIDIDQRKELIKWVHDSLTPYLEFMLRRAIDDRIKDLKVK